MYVLFTEGLYIEDQNTDGLTWWCSTRGQTSPMGLILLVSRTFREGGYWKHVLDHFNKSAYGFRYEHFGFGDWQCKITAESLQKDWAVGTWQQKSTFETIGPFLQEIWVRYPTMGACQMVTTLQQDYSLKVPKYVSIRYPSTGNKLMILEFSRWRKADYFRLMESDTVKFWKQKGFWQKWFWAAGVTDMLTCDQYNK